jgi:hypothetical protein
MWYCCMLVVAGGAELMRPDIAAFAGKAKAAGEQHCYSKLVPPTV